MVRTNTVFIVGAGASKVYGYPTGKELRNLARALDPQSDIYQFILSLGISPVNLNGFIADLKQHPAQSIDGFLETRSNSENTMKIGKTVIAALMGDVMQKAGNPRGPEEHDWLGYIFDRMLEGAGSIDDFVDGNKVTFVTFNFDSIIENRFGSDLAKAYSSHDRRYPRVIHVHGALPEFPHFHASMLDDVSRRWHPNWIEWLNRAASNINVVMDDIPRETLDAAQKVISEAGVICFLGFGYALPNLTRLGFPDIVDNKRRARPHVFGSAFDLKEGEQSLARSRFPERSRIQLSGEGLGCRDTLRHFHVFRD